MQSRGRLRSSFKFFFWEGAFALAYETWVGITYLSGLAGELNVPVFWVSALMAAPWIGSVGQVIGLLFFQGSSSLKKYTLRLALAARMLWLVPLLAAAVWGWNSRHGGDAFPVTAWFGLTALVACVSSLLATSSSAAWQSWVSAIVPSNFRGRFFGARMRYVMLSLIAAHAVATAAVVWRPSGMLAGYGLIGVFALLSALASTYLLSRVPDAPPVEKDERHWRERALRSVMEPLGNESFRRLMFFGMAFHAAIMMAGPYFPYFFIKEAGLSMSTVAFWTVLANAGALVAASFWGKKIDLGRSPERVLRFSAIAIAFSPLPYAFLSGRWLRWIGPFEYFSNGVLGVGYGIALTALLFRVVPREKNIAYFAVYGSCVGFAGALSSLLGGHLAALLDPWGGFRALWVLATVVRLAVILGVFHLVESRVSVRRMQVSLG